MLALRPLSQGQTKQALLYIRLFIIPFIVNGVNTWFMNLYNLYFVLAFTQLKTPFKNKTHEKYTVLVFIFRVLLIDFIIFSVIN